MVAADVSPLSQLYQHDETAWLEAMSKLLGEGRISKADLQDLSEYLSDMAKRDRREVASRLAVLIAHLLKWRHQPSRRSGSWRETIEVQRQELDELLESGALRNHALAILGKAYANGVRQAVAESGWRNRRSRPNVPGRWTKCCRNRSTKNGNNYPRRPG